MLSFVVKRLLQAVPVAIGVTVITFLLIHIIPGDPADVLLGPAASEAAKEQLRAALGFDRALPLQYASYVLNLLEGDLGQSFSFSQPVSAVLGDRLLNTAILALTATVLATGLGIAVGVWVALKPRSARDHALSVVVLFLNSMPSFWLGLVLILIFGLDLRWFPVSGMVAAVDGGGLGDLVSHMVLPTITLAAWSVATIAQMARASLLEIIGKDYIRTARSRGFAEPYIVFRHALPNALPPVITVVGLQMGFLLSGAVLTETVFSWPGIGLAMYQAISSRDLPLIQGGILLLALLFVLINFVVDALYGYFDPRIRVR